MDEIPRSDPNHDLAVKVRSGSIPGQKRNMLITSALILVAACSVFVFLVAGYQIISSMNVDQVITSLIPTPQPISSPTPLPNPQLYPGVYIYSNKTDVWKGWKMGHTDNDMLTLDENITNGKYHWDAQAKDGVIFYSTPDLYLYIPSDYYQISVDAQLINGAPDAAYGVIFDYTDDDNYWEWIVNEYGSSFLNELKAGSWTVTSNQFTVPIKKGAVNNLTMKISNNLLYFFVNGALVGSYKDPSPDATSFMISTRFGLCAELNNAGDKSAIEFDDFVVSHPDKFDN